MKFFRSTRGDAAIKYVTDIEKTHFERTRKFVKDLEWFTAASIS